MPPAVDSDPHCVDIPLNEKTDPNIINSPIMNSQGVLFFVMNKIFRIKFAKVNIIENSSESLKG